MPTSATGPDIGEHEKNKESVIGFLRWPLRVLFSFIIFYLSWYFNFLGDINFTGKHANIQEEINAAGSNGNNSHQISDEQLTSSAPDRPPAVVPTGDKKPGYCYGERSRLQPAERVICDSKVLSSLDMATYDAYIVKRAALQGDFQASFVERHKLWVKMWHREARKLDGQALMDYLENQFRQHIQEIQGP